jgi:glycosyltransferase involved in cell wall biosynthesis
MRGEAIALPIEEENSAALLPVLKLLAACTRSRAICVVHPDLRCQAISRWRIVWTGLGFAAASVSCLWAAHRARRELATLLSQPRATPHALTDRGAVLYLKTNLWFGIKAGGSVGHIAGVVNGLRRLGHPVTFASAEPPVMIDSDVKVLPVLPPAAFGLPYELNNYRFQHGFENKLESGGAIDTTTLIYQRLSAANYLGAVLSRSHRLPLVVEYNGSEVWVAKHWGRGMKFQKLAEMAEEAMLRHAHLVVTVSDVLRDELVERGVERSRIVSYPNCIDPLVFDPARFSAYDITKLRNSHGIHGEAVVVTFIGTFGQWHGIEVLAQSIRQLIDNHMGWVEEKKVHFLLVGDGLKMPEVREILGDHALGPFVTLTGLVPQPEAPLYLAASDILVSPHVANSDGTRFFGSPTKLFEYMAMGKAIIASDLDQIGEVLHNSIHLTQAEGHAETDECKQVALLVQPGSQKQLAVGIKSLVENPQLRQMLGRNVRSLALERYTWKRHVDEILYGLKRCMSLGHPKKDVIASDV